MTKRIKKPIFSSVYYIAFVYLFAFLIIIALQYNNHIEQIARYQFQEVSQHIRSKLALARYYSNDSFKRVEYIDQLNLINENMKYQLDSKANELYLLGKIYNYNGKDQNISFHGNNDEQLTIKDLSFNQTILKCLGYTGQLNFGQIYINAKKDNNYAIVTCYGNKKKSAGLLKIT